MGQTVKRGNAVIQPVSLIIQTGPHKNTTVDIKNYLWDDAYYNTVLKKGMSVILLLRSEDGTIRWARLMGYKRQLLIILLPVFLLAVLLAVTGKRAAGIASAMLMNLLLFFTILLPVIKKGFNPAWASIIFCIAAAGLTLFLITGFNTKSAAAATGTLISVAAAAIMAVMFQKAAGISGFFLPGARTILTMLRSTGSPAINFFLVGIAAVMIAALGMAIDVAVSISSFIQELHSANTGISRREMFLSGVSVGSDILSTMINSLVFVFLSISLPLILNSVICRISIVRFINYESVSSLIIQSLLASCILVLTVPITAASAAYLIKKYDK